MSSINRHAVPRPVRILRGVKRYLSNLTLGLVVTVLVVGLSGAKSFHLAVAHGSVEVAVAGSESDGQSVNLACSHRGCCHHGPASSTSEDGAPSDPTEEPPGDHGGGDCDLCTMIATLSSPMNAPVALDFGLRVVERVNLPRTTTRSESGRVCSVPRGPPLVA